MKNLFFNLLLRYDCCPRTSKWIWMMVTRFVELIEVEGQTFQPNIPRQIGSHKVSHNPLYILIQWIFLGLGERAQVTSQGLHNYVGKKCLGELVLEHIIILKQIYEYKTKFLHVKISYFASHGIPLFDFFLQVQKVTDLFFIQFIVQFYFSSHF